MEKSQSFGHSARFLKIATAILITALMTACAARRVEHSDHSDNDLPPPQDEKDKRIENLSTALSRAQSRIEELDAKLSALTDKVESNRLTLDNLVGTKPLKTETIGSARVDEALAAGAPAASSEEKKWQRADVKALLKQDAAIEEFNKAMSLYKLAKYTDAELAFNHFTEQYPEHILAGSAQFYSGESYLAMGEFKLALNEYGKVISSFGSSPRVASALVRLASCYEATGKAAEASRTMALARDLFAGNPSLDWTSPVKEKHPTAAPTEKTAEQPASKTELKTGPIEPTGGTDDKKIDDLNEGQQKN